MNTKFLTWGYKQTNPWMIRCVVYPLTTIMSQMIAFILWEWLHRCPILAQTTKSYSINGIYLLIFACTIFYCRRGICSPQLHQLQRWEKKTRFHLKCLACCDTHTCVYLLYTSGRNQGWMTERIFVYSRYFCALFYSQCYCTIVPAPFGY